MFLHLKIGEVSFLTGFTLETNNGEINLVDINLLKLKESVFCLFKGGFTQLNPILYLTLQNLFKSCWVFNEISV